MMLLRGMKEQILAMDEITQPEDLGVIREIMGCGVGLCMGCSRETVNGPRLSCKDGPVFRKGELL